MDLSGKVAIVTGASAGIGAATVKALHGIGMKVVGFARRKERIEQLIDNHDGRLFAVKVDVTNEQEILDGFAWVAKNVGPIHVLVNNAGIGFPTDIINGNPEVWSKIMNTNFNSILLCCREGIKNMRENGVDGHIINISSMAGTRQISHPNTSIYSSSKVALCAMTENLRLELVRLKSKIRTTCLNPGLVKTEICEASGLTKEQAEEYVFKHSPHILSEDVADTIKYLVQAPQHIQISSMNVHAVGETY